MGLLSNLAQRAAILCAAILLAPAAASAQTTAFTGATIIDGSGSAPVRDGVLVVRDGRIAAVGAAGAIAIPAGAARVDLAGKTVMPGLINAHGHLFLSNDAAAPPPRTQFYDQMALYARYGVTTVFSLGDDGVESVKLRNELRSAPPAARPAVSRLYVSGPVIEPDTAEKARDQVAQAVRDGVDVIKGRLNGPPQAPNRSPAVYGAVIEGARAANLPVAYHIFSNDEAMAVVERGAGIIGHSVRDKDPDPALIAAMKAKNVGYIPTFTRDLAVFVYESTPDFFADPFFAREAAYKPHVAPLLTPESQARYRNNAQAQSTKTALVQGRRSLKIMADAGIPIAMGTDSGAFPIRWQGYFEHLELEMMVEAGLTPAQVVAAATTGAAKVMGVDGELGALKPGYHADFLVLAANPLDDIRNSKSLEQVWISGRRVE